MQRWWAAFALIALAVFLISPPAIAQSQPPSEKLIVSAASAYTWSDGKSDIVQLDGPVTITLDSAVLSAKQAVIWLTNDTSTLIEQQRAQIVLIGDAQIKQPTDGIVRSGPQLLVTVAVSGNIRITADERLARDESNTPAFRQAQALRAGATIAATSAPASEAPPESPILEPSPSETTDAAGQVAPPPITPRAGVNRRGPATLPARLPIRFHANTTENVPTPDDTLALALTGSVTLLQTRPDGDFIELQAERCVLFTREKSNGLKDSGAIGSMGDKITGAYLEGDVRIDYTPAEKTKPEQRLQAERVYYDFTTNEAVLTNVIVHTLEPLTKEPITIRAQKLRQLSAGEYRGTGAELSTSSFATPTYSIKTDRVYVRQEQVPVQGSPYGAEQSETEYVANDVTLRAFGLPIFYLPEASGTIDKNPYPLRDIEFTNSDKFGTGIASTFGLLELLGKPRNKALDLSVQADYFSRRGPGIGLDGNYYGSNIDQDSKALSDFEGDFRSFLITDHGHDILGADRTDVDPPDQIRGKAEFEHQQFFPDHWQAQLRLGYVSDPTFLEEYYNSEYFDDHPYDAEAYFKRQIDTEAITFGANVDTNRFPSTIDQQQEQFDVERLPEIGYRRIGDSLGDNGELMFFSDSTFDRLRFARSHFSLADQGFVFITPGLPSEGYTGTETSPVYRGDSRQEVDYPVKLGQIRMVPYLVGRLTGYSDTPGGNDKERVYGAAGVRFTTAFWRIDNNVQSDLLDLHRMRHVIEPEIDLYTSSETVDRSRLYIYDEDIDGINDISAAEIALHQRFQTYRGGPGREHSVDFLTLNVSANTYTNPPKDAGILPDKFRGLYFPSDPEASIPRDSINSDLSWLISDNTALLADMMYNTDHAELATGSIGLAVKRDLRLSYYVGLRYIEQLDSDIATFATEYELTSKYTIQFSQSYDFGSGKNVDSTITFLRRFDRLTAEVSVFHNSATGDNGFRFNLIPEGFGPRGAGGVGSLFSRQ